MRNPAAHGGGSGCKRSRSWTSRTAGAGVDPHIGDFAQSGANARVGGVSINFEPFGTQLAGERHVKAAAQITNEALHLAFGLRPAWFA